MKKKDRYIIRKYVMASSAQEAIKLDKKYKPQDVWIDEDYKKDNQLSSCVGFDDGYRPGQEEDDE